jgi:hypothetical protein
MKNFNNIRLQKLFNLYYYSPLEIKFEHKVFLFNKTHNKLKNIFIPNFSKEQALYIKELIKKIILSFIDKNIGYTKIQLNGEYYLFNSNDTTIRKCLKRKQYIKRYINRPFSIEYKNNQFIFQYYNKLAYLILDENYNVIDYNNLNPAMLLFSFAIYELQLPIVSSIPEINNFITSSEILFRENLYNHENGILKFISNKSFGTMYVQDNLLKSYSVKYL